MAVQLGNVGRLWQQIPGITGVNAGGLALVNIPTNARYHRLNFFATNNGVASTAKLTSVKVLVNGVNMRDISPAQMINIAKTQGYTPSAGVLPIFFTQPWRNLLQGNDSNSWDMAGQSTFAVQIGVDPTAVNPTIVGSWEIDYLRNFKTDPGNGAQVPYLQPVAQHFFAFNGVQGQNPITVLPFDYPISRMWISAGAGNNITLLEVFQDGNKIIEGTPTQINESLLQYGILCGGANPFETAAVFDVDQRWWKALKVANSMNIRVTLSAADNIAIVLETMPGGYMA